MIGLAQIADLLLLLIGDGIKIYINYRTTGKLELSSDMRVILSIYSQREHILEGYGTSILEIDQLLKGHEEEKKNG